MATNKFEQPKRTVYSYELKLAGTVGYTRAESTLPFPHLVGKISEHGGALFTVYHQNTVWITAAAILGISGGSEEGMAWFSEAGVNAVWSKS